MRLLRIWPIFLIFSFSVGWSSVPVDTLRIFHISAPPTIDGKGDDPCWQGLPWYPIDQVWIPYGTAIETADLRGRFKVAWSAETHLLYFLVEVQDDVPVGGYRPGQTEEVYHFDILEVFIDEDRSGGLHVFDGMGEIATRYGTNAENAFAHHLYADFPTEGGVTRAFLVEDIAGEDWVHRRPVQNTRHFPEFALWRQGSLYTREFSLKVYRDTYDEADIEASRARLEAGKILGLSLAVCDNDHPETSPRRRDHLIGSVWVPPERNNHHWMDADDFGVAKLMDRPIFFQPRGSEPPALPPGR